MSEKNRKKSAFFANIESVENEQTFVKQIEGTTIIMNSQSHGRMTFQTT